MCSTLNLNGEDRRIFEICCKDFKNYILYFDDNYKRMDDNATQELPPETLVSIIMGDMSRVYQSLQSTKEVSEFLDAWIGWWWRKWQQRTKIVFCKEDLPKSVVLADNNFAINLSPEERDELTKIMVYTLIRYGEISCTQIIADALIKKTVEDMKTFKIEDKLGIISKLQRQAREVSYTHGALIFLTLDNYFKLREWRNDETANKII